MPRDGKGGDVIDQPLQVSDGGASCGIIERCSGYLRGHDAVVVRRDGSNRRRGCADRSEAESGHDNDAVLFLLMSSFVECKQV